MRDNHRFLVAAALALFMAPPAGAQYFEKRNHDEGKVTPYVLPDPLTTNDGKKVGSVALWTRTRRPEILRLFETEMYGRSPARPSRMRFVTTSIDKKALGGKATRKEVSVLFTGDPAGPKMDLLLYLPNNVKRPVPAFASLNFYGNHAVHADPGITMSKQWMREEGAGIVDHKATLASRGSQVSRWPVEAMLDRGYALVTAYYGDLDPDYDHDFKYGVYPLSYRSGQSAPAADEWGSVSAWAWGLRRAMDYIETDRDIDARRVAVVGLSRLGKTALWAGAQDQRFAVVISNESGDGGAALSRRWFGNNLQEMPHRWFCKNLEKYHTNVGSLPMDQHMLIALVAPRPVYVASASEDPNADLRGEFLGIKNAEPVYRLFGFGGLGVDDMPAVDHPVRINPKMGYHIRTGKHDITAYDWEQYFAFVDPHFKPARPRP